MRVMGIDPGLNVTGYGILDSDDDACRVIEGGVIRTDQRRSLASRLREIGSEMAHVLSQFRPEAVAVEELYSNYAHPRTAIIMGHARGVILSRIAEAGITVFSYPSTRIKNSLTGNGRAGKKQVQLMIRSTLGLPEAPEPPDIADAFAVALCHIQAMEHEQLKKV
jgi:crossover junction endodeoxyribonuclease RuvC